MNRLFETGNQFARESDWKDFALLKLCLCAMGIIIGAQVAPKCKKTAIFVSAGVFLATYIPLMTKVFKIMARDPFESGSAATKS